MTNNHNILKLLEDILIKNGNLQRSYSNIDELILFFKYLIETRENFNSAYLLNYLYQNISAMNRKSLFYLILKSEISLAFISASQ